MPKPDHIRWQDALVGGWVALVVARVLVPEDPGGQLGLGAPLDVLWMVLAALWLLGQLQRDRVRFRFGWPDALVVGLVAWHSASALVAMANASPRSAMNMLWDWVAMGLVFLLARQMVHARRDARATLAVMIGLAGGLSAVAFHQYFVTLPADAATYDAAKHSLETLYEATGQWLPEGSNIRQQFEARLASRLPTANFALSNSLAGFLTGWLVTLVGIAFELRGRWVLAATWFAVAVMAATIWLTGSRSAGLAVIVGVMLVVADRALSQGWSRRWIQAVVAVALATAAIGGAAAVATPLGRAALGAAWRSLTFRFEYWQATLAMIADAPIFGCGPGQFQDTYTAYKLVGAGEEIQDPHNWLLEVAATAGIPAAILLIAALVVVTARAFRRDASRDVPVPRPSATTPNRAALVGGLAGVALGTVLAWLTGYSLAGTHIVLLAVGIVAGWLIWGPWVRDGVLPRRLPLLAATALLVNLLAAGGIGFPSVADSLWLLLAMEVNLSEGESAAVTSRAQRALESWFRRRPVRWTACLLLAAAIALMIRMQYAPVIMCRIQMAAADAALAEGRIGDSREALEAAVAADPWSALAAARLADQRFADYLALPTQAQQRSLDAAAERMRQLAPRRSRVWAQSAAYAEAIYRETQDVQYLEAAKRYFQRAIERYPTSAEHHAQAARFWQAVGDDDRARAAAAEALRLDDALRAAGHFDRALPSEQRLELELRAESLGSPTSNCDNFAATIELAASPVGAGGDIHHATT